MREAERFNGSAPKRGSDGRSLTPRKTGGFVTIKDVAAHAGVSIATVSRAINDNGYVATDVKARVLASMQELGFRPSQRARSMRSSRTMSIGAIVSELVNPVHLEFLRGVESAANESGYVVLVVSSQGSPEKERESLGRLVAERVDGVVLGTFVGGRRSLDILAEHNIAHVPPAGPVSEALNSAWMRAEAAATHEMGRRLVELGHKRVAYVVFQETPGRRAPGYHHKARYEVLRELFGAAGVALDMVNLAGLPAEGAPAEEIVQAARSVDPPTAWVACNHILLPYLLDGLAGLGIPEDVSVVGYGDSIWAEAYRPPITVVSHDTYREARALTSMLLDSINGRPLAPEGVEYRSQFIERSSVGPARR